MTTPWTPPTLSPLATASDAQSGQFTLFAEEGISNPSGPPT